MKNASKNGAATRPGTPAELFAAQVLGEGARAAELLASLPDHVPPERFQRNLLHMLMLRPELLAYDVRLVHREVSKAAALGLLLDPQLGEAFLLPAWNPASKREEPALRVGYRGLIKLARQSGEVANIYAHEVHEKDVIECDLGFEKRLVHKPDLFGERGTVVGYYAVLKYRDGTTDFEPMTLQQVHVIRDRSDSWCAFKSGKTATSPWASDEDEMGKKTAIKRLLKRAPQSPDLTVALRLDEEAASGESSNVIPMTGRVAVRPTPRSIAARLDSFANGGGDAMPCEAAASLEGVAEARTDRPLTAKLLKAMDRGRTARRKQRPRKAPKALAAKSRHAEADAFLRGWDEEHFEARAEAFGSL